MSCTRNTVHLTRGCPLIPANCMEEVVGFMIDYALIWNLAGCDLCFKKLRKGMVKLKIVQPVCLQVYPHGADCETHVCLGYVRTMKAPESNLQRHDEEVNDSLGSDRARAMSSEPYVWQGLAPPLSREPHRYEIRGSIELPWRSGSNLMRSLDRTMANEKYS